MKWRDTLALGCRITATLFFSGLIAWGLALGAWLATTAVLILMVLTWRTVTRWTVLSAMVLFGLVGTVGAAETLWRVDQIGERSRAGDLGIRDQLGVYGFNVAFGTSAIVLGFTQFGNETLSLGIPFSVAGQCPEDRLRSYIAKHPEYRSSGPSPSTARLRRWHSDFAMRSPKVRAIVRQWANGLASAAPEGTERKLGPKGPITWPASAYFSPNEANGVPVALNAYTTMEGHATRIGSRWRMDLLLHLPVAYPKRNSNLQVGPFTLAEGMFYDARSVLQPYCGEYRWTTWSDDPQLQSTEPIRTVREIAMTGILRGLGAHY